MTRAGVRDLRYNFPALERRLRRGEEIEITKRGKPIGKLTGLAPPRRVTAAEIMAWQKRVYGDKVMDVEELIRWSRGGDE